MGALVNHLREMVSRGCSERELVQAVEDELRGGDLLDDELSDYDDALREASAREHELQDQIARVSGRRAADREVLRLTLLYAHRGGLYLPGDTDDGAALARGAHWRAQEAVRFACFAVIARSLVRRLESGGLPSTDYPSAVTELATRLARISVHNTRRRGPV